MKVVHETKGYQVGATVNSKEGAKLPDQGKPDLIILDVMMDTMWEGFILTAS
jgi:DNA-binding response OmpR family regulator